MSSKSKAFASAGGAPRHHVVFVHGFLDAGSVWDDVVSAMDDPALAAVQVNLAGMGERKDATGPFSLDRFAQDVGATCDAIGGPFVIVGQSMGAQVAELVAARRPRTAIGLVLVTPVPLRGFGAPLEVIDTFKALGGQPDAQRAVRKQLTAGLSEAGLSKLTARGLELRPATVSDLADAWNNGHANGDRASEFSGPTLIVNGDADGFVTAGLIDSSIAPRFPGANRAVVHDAGHWPHVEQPAMFAGLLRNFINALPWSTGGNANSQVRPQGWTRAFADKSADSFAAAFDSQVVLDATVLARPVEGIDQVKIVMAAASKIYEKLEFTQEAVNGRRTYLEWDAQALGGVSMRGITILTKNDAGKIIQVAIHHRPLGSALRFSTALRDSVAEWVDSSFFHQGA